VQGNWQRNGKLWAAAVVAMLALLTWNVSRGVGVSTNILDLLPVTEQDPAVEAAARAFSDHMAQRSVFLVEMVDDDPAAAETFAKVLRESKVFVSVSCQIDEDQETAWYKLYFPYRFQLVGDEVRALLKSDAGGAAVTKRARDTLYSPVGSAVAGLIENDPLLLFPDRMTSLAKPPGAVEAQDGYLVVTGDGKSYVLIAAVAESSPFARSAQKVLAPAVANAHARVATDHGNVTILTAGVLPFAVAATEAAEGEVSTIGVGSMLGVILLMLLTFVSIRQMAVSFVPILVGISAALAVSWTLYPTLHLLTLGFGASLVGICIDYSFHYFADQLVDGEEWTPDRCLERILPGIRLGMITSVIAYAGLFIAPFPGLRQMALFSSVGLVAAFLTVVCWYPFLCRRASESRRPALLQAIQPLSALWANIMGRSWRWLLLAVALVFIGIGVSRLRPNDDVRQLQHAPEALLAQDRAAQKLLGGIDSNRYFVVEGETADGVLNNEEALLRRLAPIQRTGAVQFAQGTSQFVPSTSAQSADHARLRDAMLGEDNALTTHMRGLGFEDAAIDRAVAALREAPSEFLTVDAWLASPISRPLRHLWLGETPRGFASIVYLAGVTDETQLLAVESELDSVNYVNKVDDVSKIFRRYRRLASALVAGAYAFILLLLVVRYGPRRGLLVALPPMLAAGLTLAILGFSGQLVNIFTMLALLLVLGIGIDYAIFLAEGEDHRESTLLAVLLSSLTTLLAFGLLALSKTPVLHTFGVAVLIGITLALLLAPMVQAKVKAGE
jgi:predicted exporter